MGGESTEPDKKERSGYTEVGEMPSTRDVTRAALVKTASYNELRRKKRAWSNPTVENGTLTSSPPLPLLSCVLDPLTLLWCILRFLVICRVIVYYYVMERSGEELCCVGS